MKNLLMGGMVGCVVLLGGCGTSGSGSSSSGSKVPTSEFLYVDDGANTNNLAALNDNLYGFAINPTTGAATGTLPTIALGAGCACAWDPAAKSIYAVNDYAQTMTSYSASSSTGILTQTGEFSTGKYNDFVYNATGKMYDDTSSGTGNIYSINPTTGALTNIGNWATPAQGQPVFDNTGNYAYFGYYTSSGSTTTSYIAAYTVSPTLGTLSQIATYTVSNTTENSIVIDPSNKFLYFIVGSSALRTDSINSSTGALTFLASYPVAGITGLVVSPTDNFAYAVDEFGGTMPIFSINSSTGVLTQQQATTEGNDPLVVDPTGTLAWGIFDENELVAYSINQTTGALTQTAILGTSPYPYTYGDLILLSW